MARPSAGAQESPVLPPCLARTLPRGVAAESPAGLFTRTRRQAGCGRGCQVRFLALLYRLQPAGSRSFREKVTVGGGGLAPEQMAGLAHSPGEVEQLPGTHMPPSTRTLRVTSHLCAQV